MDTILVSLFLLLWTPYNSPTGGFHDAPYGLPAPSLSPPAPPEEDFDPTLDDYREMFLDMTDDERREFLTSLGPPEAALKFLMLFAEIPPGKCRGTYGGDFDKFWKKDDRVCHV